MHMCLTNIGIGTAHTQIEVTMRINFGSFSTALKWQQKMINIASTKRFDAYIYTIHQSFSVLVVLSQLCVYTCVRRFIHILTALDVSFLQAQIRMCDEHKFDKHLLSINNFINEPKFISKCYPFFLSRSRFQALYGLARLEIVDT